MAVETVFVEYRGERLSIKELSARCGIRYTTLYQRIQVSGFDVERAVSQPIKRCFQNGGRVAKNVPRPVPKLKRHTTGSAYVRWKMCGTPHERYFGRYGTKDAAELYRKFASDWNAGKYDVAPTSTHATGAMSVGALVVRFLAHCESYYVKDGKTTTELKIVRPALRILTEHCGNAPATEFKPADLREVREKMVKANLVRTTCNAYCNRIVRMFAWGASQSMFPAAVHSALVLVETLKPGRTTAPDRDRKKPVTAEQITATLPELAPADKKRGEKYAAMIRLQRLTGMRPGEVCAMAPAEVDRGADVWRYEVGKANKNRHRGKAQVYYFGPRAVEILRPYLEACSDPKARIFGENREAYSQAVIQASVRAKRGKWSPHQLRHALATEVAEKFRSIEHAAAAIGDGVGVAEAVYVHIDPKERAKIEVAKAMG